MDVMLSLRANSAPGDGVASGRPASTPISRISIPGRQPEGRIEQMTAAESFDAGIARQIGQYADAVRVPAGYDHILVSGTPGLAPDGSLPGDMTGQATRAWQNIQTTLSQAGPSLSAIVSVRQWLTSAEDVRAYVEVRSKFITQ
jgi:enamine deaminase RidA (YjgF/YER057c/UK114 family)